MGCPCDEAALIVLSLTILRVLIPILAIGFLIQEGLEVFELRQLTSITLFASFYLVAGYQLAVGRTLTRMARVELAGEATRNSALMFLATLFSAIDAALDSLIQGFSISHTNGLAVPLFLIGWLVNLFAIVLAVISLIRFLPVVTMMLQAPVRETTYELNLADD